MKITAKTNVLIGVGALIGLMALSQYTTGRIAEPESSTINNISGKNTNVELQIDTLFKATETVNASWRNAFNKNEMNLLAIKSEQNVYDVMQSQREKGFADYQIKTLGIIDNDNVALHSAIWGVARELPNGERELAIGRIETSLRKQNDGNWVPVESTWTQTPF
jgi:hypothetical protein